MKRPTSVTYITNRDAYGRHLFSIFCLSIQYIDQSLTHKKSGEKHLSDIKTIARLLPHLIIQLSVLINQKNRLYSRCARPLECFCMQRRIRQTVWSRHQLSRTGTSNVVCPHNQSTFSSDVLLSEGACDHVNNWDYLWTVRPDSCRCDCMHMWMIHQVATGCRLVVKNAYSCFRATCRCWLYA